MTTSVLVADELTYRYPHSERVVVNEFSHCFTAGSMSALVAPSGAGKSTLLSLLGLLLRPSNGRVLVLNESVTWRRYRGPGALRTRSFGWVLQNNTCLEARSVVDNVSLTLLAQGVPISQARRAAREALEALGLAKQTELLARQLSGGEQQRMTIARALACERPILLADEPTGNLDAANSEHVFRALRDCANRGTCVIVATHDLQMAGSCDEVIALGSRSQSAEPL